MDDNNLQQSSVTVNNRPEQSDRPEPTYIESRLTWALDQIGLFSHVTQYQIGSKIADIAFPDAQLIVECDGYAYHHTREDRERDTGRDMELEIMGWHVLRFTGSQINKDALACALKIKYVHEHRVSMLNTAVSKALCANYEFPASV